MPFWDNLFNALTGRMPPQVLINGRSAEFMPIEELEKALDEITKKQTNVYTLVIYKNTNEHVFETPFIDTELRRVIERLKKRKS